MSGNYNKYFKSILIAGDLLLINLLFLLVCYLQIGHLTVSPYYLLYLTIYNILFLSLASYFSIYQIHRTERKRSAVFKLIKTILFSILILEGGLNIIGFYQFNWDLVGAFYISVLIILPISRMVLLQSLKYYRLSGYNYRNIVIIGYTEAAQRLVEYFDQHPELGYRCRGIFDDEATYPGIVGTTDSLLDLINSGEVDEIYCSSSKCDNQLITNIMEVQSDIKLHWLPQNEWTFSAHQINMLGDIPVLLHQSLSNSTQFMKALKRAFDIVFSLFIIITILSWLLPILSLIIMMDSRGPAIFRQKRTGLNNKPFLCFKLRTMRVNPLSTGDQATKEDDRITPIGHFLRKTNLDEIPQFINVLLGHMSIVGPRPHMVEHTAHYSKMIDQFMVRHIVKPGITGLSQVKGFRGETINPILMESRIKEDIYYMMHWSFLLDLKIILLTVLNMIKGEENAY